MNGDSLFSPLHDGASCDGGHAVDATHLAPSLRDDGPPRSNGPSLSADVVPLRREASRTAPTSDVACDRCDAVCCRLTVVVQPDDGIAEHLTTVTDHGLRVMARDEEGWCVAVDAAHMRCSIYDARPDVCRRFQMGGAYCEAVREDYSRDGARQIAAVLVGAPR